MRPFLTIIALLFGSILSAPAFALNTWGTDMSDMWWNPSESGWGANIVHQQDVVFMTIFVYGADSRVRWYVAPDMRYQSQTGSGAYVFSGTLYETTGPSIGGPFNPNSVTTRQVGTASATLLVESGALNYSVDGVSVTKSITRQTFRNNNLTGSYYGGASAIASGCGANSGTFESASLFAVNQSGSSLSITASISGGLSCTYSGTYSQIGRMGHIDGTLSCSNGRSGTFQAFEIEASALGFLTRYTANYGGGCTEAGRIGGLKR